MRTNPIEIINQLKSGNQQALAKLYDAYGDIIYGVALEILKDEQVAQEVLQDTFVKVWKNIDKYDPSKSRIFSWVYKIGRNTAIDKYRSLHRYSPIDSSILAESYVMEENIHDKLDVNKMIKSLDSEFAEVLELSYIYGFTHEDVSKKLKIPLGTVKSRIRIGLKKLRARFTDTKLISILTIVSTLNLI